MAVTLSGTGITLNDSSVITTAIPAVDGVGAIRQAIMNINSPYPAANDTIYHADYAAGTTVAGSSLAADFYFGNGSYAPNSPGRYNGTPAGTKRQYNARTALSLPASGTALNLAGGAQLWGAMATQFGYSNSANSFGLTGGAYIGYSSLSGSWRSLNATTISCIYDTYTSQSIAYHWTTFWQRYA